MTKWRYLNLSEAYPPDNGKILGKDYIRDEKGNILVPELTAKEEKQQAVIKAARHLKSENDQQPVTSWYDVLEAKDALYEAIEILDESVRISG